MGAFPLDPTLLVHHQITQDVLKDLRGAAAARKVGDDRLLVISYSFGGESCYEIFSHYAPEVKVDC